MPKVHLRRALKILGIIAGIIVVAILGIFFALQSSFVLNRVLPPIQQVLERDFQLKTKIDQLSIDPLARVSLKGVEAQWTNPALGSAELKVESLLLRFSLRQILNRRLQVSSLEVVNPSVKAVLKLVQKSEEKPPENPLSLLRNLIVTPPVALNVDSVSIKGLKLDITAIQGKSTIKFFAEPINLDTRLQVVPRNFSVAVDVSIGSRDIAGAKNGTLRLNAMQLTPQLPVLAVEAPIALRVGSQLGLSFVDDQNPKLSLSPVTVEVAGERMQVNSRLDKSGQFRLELAQLALRHTKEAETQIDLSEIFQLEKASGKEFVAQVPDKIFTIIAQLNLVLKNEISIEKMKVAARIPSAGIDAEVVLDAKVPVQFAKGSDGLSLDTGGLPINAQIQDLRLQGQLFSQLGKTIKVEQLRGTRFSTPLKLQLGKPTFRNPKRVLEGLRVEKFDVEPILLLGQSETPLLKTQVSVAQSAAGEFSLDTRTQMTLRENLLALTQLVKPLKESLGWLDVNADLSVKAKTPWGDLQKLMDDKNKDVRSLEVKYRVDLSQAVPPPKNAPTALQLPGGLQIRGEAKVNAPLIVRGGQVATQVDWDKKPLLTNTLEFDNAPGKFSLKGESKVDALLRLRQITPLADAMGLLGGSKLDARWSVALPHSGKSILSAALPPPLLLDADVLADVAVSFPEKPTKPLFEDNMLLIEGPVKAKIKAALRRGKAKVGIKYAVPKVGTLKLAVVDKLEGAVDLEAPTDLKEGLSANVEAKLAELAAHKSFGLPEEALPYLKNISANLQLKTDIVSRVDLESVKVDTGAGLFSVSLRGGTDLKATNSRFEGQLSVRPPAVFRYGIRAQDKVALDGIVRVGWQLTQKDQKSLRLRGNVNLDNFAAQHQLGGISKVTGRIPFLQELELLNFKQLRWAYLIRDNPFKRVDTSKFVPLTTDDSLLTVGELNALERKFGPLRARVSLQQNMLTLDKLDADLFEGVLAGQGFIDIQPARLQAGLQGRITKLNTALLSSKPEKMTPAPLSSRLALVVDLSRALIEGRVDVTEIGRNQLLAFMDVLDPTGADSMMNNARLALSAGYPRYVGMQMQQGFLDLDIGLGGILEQQFKISNLPLSPIVNAKTQDLVKTMREVPIQ